MGTANGCGSVYLRGSCKCVYDWRNLPWAECQVETAITREFFRGGSAIRCEHFAGEIDVEI